MLYCPAHGIPVTIALLACMSASTANAELISIDFDESFYPNDVITKLLKVVIAQLLSICNCMIFVLTQSIPNRSS